MRVLQAARGAALTLPREGDPGGAGADASPTDADADAPAPSVDVPTGRRRVGLLAVTAALLLAADIVTKIIAVEVLADREPVELLGGLLTLTETRNPGAAFGLAGGLTVIFTVVAVGVIAAIVRVAPRLRSAGWAVSLGLLLGGAAGNLVDRVLRDPAPFRGAVVDWIELPNWPVFNLADTGICLGGALAVLLSLRGDEIDGPRARS